MKVLIVSQYFWPESFLINDLAVGLVARGHKVTVLTGKPNYPDGSFFPGYGFTRPLREDYKGIRVLRVPLIPRGSGRAVSLVLNYLSYVLFAGLLGPLLCRGKFDLIFVFEPSPVTVGLPAMVMKKIKKAPLVLWVQDLWPESLSATGAVSSNHVLKVVDRMVRFIYRGCDRVLVQSRGFVARIEAQGVRPADIVYFPNWAEALYESLELEADAPERREMPDGFRILFAGNVGVTQSFETILGAAERLKKREEIHWVILGDGRRREWVQTRVQDLGLENQVHLLGKRALESMPRYFSLADVLLVSLRRELLFSLTIPSKVQTYLASGRPVIGALDGEGAHVIEESGAGLIVPTEDPEALAQAVLTLYKTPKEKREEMGRRGRAYFEERFEREKLLNRLEGWMEELVGGRS